MDFHPHRFHPTRYAQDPYDLLLPVNENHAAEKEMNWIMGECGHLVERDTHRIKGGYTCFDCKRENQKKYDKKHKKSRRFACLANHCHV